MSTYSATLPASSRAASVVRRSMATWSFMMLFLSVRELLLGVEICGCGSGASVTRGWRGAARAPPRAAASLSHSDWKMASVARKSTCSKRDPEYWRETLEPWSVFWAAGMITSASASPASGESGLVVNAAIRAPAFAAVSAALTTPEVVPEPEATRSRSPELMAGVVVSPATWTFSPRCISLHGGHPQDQTAAARSGDKHAVCQADVACEGGHLLFVDLGCRVCDLVPDEGQVAHNVICGAIHRRGCCRIHDFSLRFDHRPVAAGWMLSG